MNCIMMRILLRLHFGTSKKLRPGINPDLISN